MADAVRRLAIVGASARAAAMSALAGGYSVMAADLFADADLQRACDATRISGYPEGLADWLAATECDAWLYTGALENRPELVDRMAAIRPLLGNRGDALRAVRDPLAVQRAMVDEGVEVPETIAADATPPLDGSWLAKTYRGASGAGVWRLDGATALEKARREGAVLQRYVEGTPVAAVFVCSAAGARLLGVTRQLVGDVGAGARPWQYAGSIGPLALGAAAESHVRRVGDAMHRRWTLGGIVGVDLIIADDRVWLIEINPRYTASVEVIERLSGVSAIAAHVEACQGRLQPAPRGLGEAAYSAAAQRAGSSGKIILFARQDVTISQPFFDWAVERASSNASERELADLPRPGEQIRAGDPALTVLAHSEAPCCEALLRERLEEVSRRLYAGA